jgi:hypothetical protein
MDAFTDPLVRAVVSNPIGSFNCPSDDKPSPTADRPNLKSTKGVKDANDVVYNDIMALTNYVGNMGRGRDATTRFNVDRWYQANFGLWAEGPFNANSHTTFGDISDGTSNSIMVGERAWSYGAGGTQIIGGASVMLYATSTKGPTEGGGISNALGLGGSGINGIYPSNIDRRASGSYSSNHVGGAQFALCDGSVQFLSENIDYNTATGNYDSAFEYLLAIADGGVLGGGY